MESGATVPLRPYLSLSWRPRDLIQREGRIIRQGNKNKKVHIHRYVTESSFDAYLWQTVETKQRFISQIMTSKSPVRSCEDVDDTALSYAEVKALCAGDPRIKERMDLDVDVSRLKILKANHQSNRFRLEDSLLHTLPQKISACKETIRGLELDLQMAQQTPKDGFAGLELKGEKFTEKKLAGAALLDLAKAIPVSDPVPIGQYRGFQLSLGYDPMQKMRYLSLKGQLSHLAEMGSDANGNIQRLDNAISKISDKLQRAKERLEDLYRQQNAAKAELDKPFPHEQELAEKIARLIELDAQLNLEQHSEETQKTQTERTIDMNQQKPYTHSAQYAAEHGETELYRASHLANVACREAIESAMERHYRNDSLDTAAAKAEVLEQFGLDRTLFVLANTVQHKQRDRRFSLNNRAWAETVEICAEKEQPDRTTQFVVEKSHPGLVNLFLTRVLEEAKRQEAERASEYPAERPAASSTERPAERPSLRQRLQEKKAQVRALELSRSLGVAR